MAADTGHKKPEPAEGTGRRADKTESKLTKSAASKRPNSGQSLSSRHYYQLSRRIWRILLFTVPADILLLAVDISFLDVSHLAELCRKVLPLLMVLALSALLREPILDFVVLLGKTQGRFYEWSSKYSLLLLAAAGFIVFAEIAFKLGSLDLVSLLIAAVVTVSAVKSIKDSLKAKHEHQEKLKDEPLLWLEEADAKVFWLSVIPMAAARLISVVGTVLVVCQNGMLLVFFAYILTAVFLLLELEPLQEHFLIYCKRCGQRTSRALKSSGRCPSCEREIQAWQANGALKERGFAQGRYGVKIQVKDKTPPSSAVISWPQQLKEKLSAYKGPLKKQTSA